MNDGLFLRWSAATPDEVKPGVRALVTSMETIEVGVIRLAPGTTLVEHAHPEEQIFYVLSGRLRYRIGEVEDVAGPGDVIRMPSGAPHAGRVEGDAEAVFVEVKNRRPAAGSGPE